MTILTKQQILSSDDLPSETVEVPEWGGGVVIRSMTGRERDQYEETLLEGKVGGDIRTKGLRSALLLVTCVDGEGNHLFDSAEELEGKSAKVINRLWEVSMRVSGMTEEEVEELVGN